MPRYETVSWTYVCDYKTCCVGPHFNPDEIELFKGVEGIQTKADADNYVKSKGWEVTKVGKTGIRVLCPLHKGSG